MGSIKDRNGLDLTEAEDIKKRWREYREELYKKFSFSPFLKPALDHFSSVQFSSVGQSGLTLCDLMDCSRPDFSVLHQLPGLSQTHVL